MCKYLQPAKRGRPSCGVKRLPETVSLFLCRLPEHHLCRAAWEDTKITRPVFFFSFSFFSKLVPDCFGCLFFFCGRAREGQGEWEKRGRERERERESERECVSARACVGYVCVFDVICDGIPPSVSKNPRAVRGGGGGGQERRRRRRADLSTSPHCGTRGAAAGDPKPTLNLDSGLTDPRASTGFLFFIFFYSYPLPPLLPQVSAAEWTIWHLNRKEYYLPTSGEERWIYPCGGFLFFFFLERGGLDGEEIDGLIRRQSRMWFPLLPRAPEWSNRLQCHLHLAAWRDVSREWGTLRWLD